MNEVGPICSNLCAQQVSKKYLDRLCVVGGCNYRIAGAKIEVDDHIVMHHASYNRPEFDAETEALVIRMGVR